MKTKTILTGLILMSLISQMGFAVGAAKVTASIEVYSGRGTVQWDMTPSELSELAMRIQKLPAVQLKKIPTESYVVIKNDGDASFPYSQVYVFTKGMVIAQSSSSKNSYLDDKGELMAWLLDQGNKHDPTYVAPKYKTLPQNTPYIAFTPASFEETVPQGTPLNLRLTVFSEGNAPLEGVFETPGYVTADKKSFKLPPIEGIEDYTFSIDTTAMGEKIGEITIRSNDPSRGEVKIPVKVTVGGVTVTTEAPAVTQPVEQQGGGGVNYFFYLIVLLVLAAVAIFVYTKRNKKK
jgi:hypothetical protein